MLAHPAMDVVIITACKSVKETSCAEMYRWNAINPISEKPKFGRGTCNNEMK